MASDCSPNVLVTDVSFVALLTSVPPNHTVLSKTVDSKEDADLWRDRFLSRKTRYLCFASVDTKECDPKCTILTNIVLLNDGDFTPAGHQPVTYTKDTGERALKKKVLYTSFQPLDSAKHAVVDIVITRGNRYNPSYQLVGELNSLSIFCKKVPLTTPFGRQSFPAHGDISLRPNPSPAESHLPSHTSPQFQAFATKRRGTVHPLSGIPFEINKKYVSDLPDGSENDFTSVNPKTMEQLDCEYQYRFSVERSLLQT